MVEVNKLKEKRSEISRECQSLLDATPASGVMTAENKARFDTLEKESKEIADTIQRSERSTAESAELAKFKPVASGVTLELSNKEMNSYSIVRAARNLLEGKPVDGLEGEVSRTIAKQTNSIPRGFYIPTHIPGFFGGNREIARAFDVGTNATSLVTQEWQGFIEYLRNRSALLQTGCTVMENLSGLVNIPIKSATTTAYWLAEGNAPTGSTPGVTTSIQLSPKTVGAYTDLTRSLMKQSSYGVEQMVRGDLVDTIALAIDAAGIGGTGANNQPTGLLTSISSLTLASDVGLGGAMALADIIKAETTIAAANADVNSMAWVLNAKTRGKLKQTAVIGSTYPQFLYANDNTVNGYKAYISNQLASNLVVGSSSSLSAGVFGDFSQLIIGMWGGIDLALDPYSLSTSGGLRLVALQNIDVGVRHTGSFVTFKDISTV